MNTLNGSYCSESITGSALGFSFDWGNCSLRNPIDVGIWFGNKGSFNLSYLRLFNFEGVSGFELFRAEMGESINSQIISSAEFGIILLDDCKVLHKDSAPILVFLCGKIHTIVELPLLIGALLRFIVYLE